MHILLLLTFIATVFSDCKPPKNPPEEITLVNAIKKLIAQKLPIAIPQNLGFGINGSNIMLTQPSIVAAEFLNADIDVPMANTVHMQFTNLRWNLAFQFSIQTGQAAPQTGSGMLMMGNSSLTYTAALLPNDFKGIDSKLTIVDIAMTATNNAILPFFNNIRPQLIQGLTTQLPQLLLTLNTQFISTQVIPLVKFIEPIHLPNVSASNIIGSITLTNMALYGIKVLSANMKQGAQPNVVDFSMRNMSANATAAWSVTAPFVGTFSGNAVVAIVDVSTDTSLAYGIDKKNQFTYQLFAANMTIANAKVNIDNNSKALQNIVDKLTPFVIKELEANLEKRLCSFVNGN